MLDYIVNLSIFSLMICLPLVALSFINLKPIKYINLLCGFYAGIVSIILVELAFQQQGYIYDIRYASVILSFAYLGPWAGILTGSIALGARLFEGGHWLPATIGWTAIAVGFICIHLLFPRISSAKKTVIIFITYVGIYVVTVPIYFNILRDQPLFHVQYILFVMLGVFVGGLLTESYLRQFRLNGRLTDMYKMVEESEAKYRLIAENTSDLIMVMDKEHAISYFSPSHELVLGYEIHELAGTELCQFIHPDDVETFISAIRRMFEKKESQSIEFRFRHKDGRWIEFESRCMPVEGENQAIEHIVIVSRDISERKKSEEILLQSEKLSVVGELAAGVAHEIRNPLTTIKGFVQLYRAKDQTFEFSELLLNELERIETITSELLSLGKPQAITLTRVTLQELLEKTLELLSPQALMHDIQFELVMEEAPIFIRCEKNQLKQVFLNILKNAMEAMPEGGYIRIQLEKGGEDECLVSVQDQGCGIPEQLLPRLGEPFYTLKEKGTGLGLMICHKIVKQHNGTITYQSKEQEGTLVQIKLPVTE